MFYVNLQLTKQMFIINLKQPINGFNDFFTNIDQKLARKTPKSPITIKTYISKVNAINDSLSVKELKGVFVSLEINKSSGVNVVSFNIIKKCFEVL